MKKIILFSILILGLFVVDSWAYRDYYKGTARAGSTLLAGATVRTYLAGTATVAGVYTSLAADSSVNSVTAAADGTFEFWVDRFDYKPSQAFKLTLSKSGYTSITFDNQQTQADVIGNYAITSAKTFQGSTIPDGVTYTLSGAGAITFTNIDSVRPEWFGAVGDSSTNSTVGLQAAITAAAAGNKVVQLSGDPTHSYKFSNLTIPNNVKIKGLGSEITVLERITGSTGTAITEDASNALNIVLEDFALVGASADAGSGLSLGVGLGTGGTYEWGDEGYINNINVTGFPSGTAVALKGNATRIRNLSVGTSNVGLSLSGSTVQATDIVAHGCSTNVQIIGTAHRLNKVYSESANTTHVQFGDGTATTTTRNIITDLAFNFKASATTTNGILVTPNSGGTVQINQVFRASPQFNTGSTVTYIINDVSNNVVAAHPESDDTILGTFDYNPDKRDFTKTKVLTDADFANAGVLYTMYYLTPYDTYIVDVSGAVSVYLPHLDYSYGRTIEVINDASPASTVTVYPQGGSAVMIVPGTAPTTHVNSLAVTTGLSRRFTCTPEGHWYARP